MGLTEVIQKAFLATIIPPDFKATAFGVYASAVGAGNPAGQPDRRPAVEPRFADRHLLLRRGHGNAFSDAVYDVIRVHQEWCAKKGVTRYALQCLYSLAVQGQSDPPDSLFEMSGAVRAASPGNRSGIIYRLQDQAVNTPFNQVYVLFNGNPVMGDGHNDLVTARL